MSEPYDDDYYQDNYDDSHDYYNSYNDSNWKKFYFKFDVDSSPLSEWITKMINNIINDTNIYGFSPVGLPVPVNSWNPNTENQKFQYLGSNYAKEPIWKSKYWINHPIDKAYISHLQSNAKHFVQQPTYYKGLFDILN